MKYLVNKAIANYDIYTVSKPEIIPKIRVEIVRSLTKMQEWGGSLVASWLREYLECPYTRGRLLNFNYPYDNKVKVQKIIGKIFDIDEALLLYQFAVDMRQ